MKNLILILSLFLFIISCEKDTKIDSETYPKCMQFEVDNVLNHNTTSVKAYIKIYKYQNIIVYAFYEGNIVEGQTRIYDENCVKICEFGGIGGSQMNTCENWESAEFIETVWEDPR
jgi:hypothetical protein